MSISDIELNACKSQNDQPFKDDPIAKSPFFKKVVRFQLGRISWKTAQLGRYHLTWTPMHTVQLSILVMTRPALLDYIKTYGIKATGIILFICSVCTVTVTPTKFLWEKCVFLDLCLLLMKPKAVLFCTPATSRHRKLSFLSNGGNDRHSVSTGV